MQAIAHGTPESDRMVIHANLQFATLLSKTLLRKTSSKSKALLVANMCECNQPWQAYMSVRHPAALRAASEVGDQVSPC